MGLDNGRRRAAMFGSFCSKFCVRLIDECHASRRTSPQMSDCERCNMDRRSETVDCHCSCPGLCLIFFTRVVQAEAIAQNEQPIGEEQLHTETRNWMSLVRNKPAIAEFLHRTTSRHADPTTLPAQSIQNRPRSEDNHQSDRQTDK